jgi:hypothetical protein
MDPNQEEQEFLRQQDEAYWDAKRLDEQQPRRTRGRTTQATADEDAAAIAAREPVQEPDAPPAPKHQRVKRDMPNQSSRSRGRAVKSGIGVLLLLMCAAAAFALWSDAPLPWLAKKTQQVEVAALPAPDVSLTPAPLPPTVTDTGAGGPAVTTVVAAPDDSASADQAKLLAQIEQLTARVDQLIAGFRAKGYLKDTAGIGGADLVVDDFQPHPSTLPAPVRASATPRAAARPTVRPMAPAPAPKPSHQVLSVDMWDGRPSVVIGMAGASADQVRVLQPGDSYNGVTLTSVDVPAQRATFSDGARSVSMAVERQP